MTTRSLLCIAVFTLIYSVLSAEFKTAHSGSITSIAARNEIIATSGTDGIVKISSDQFRSIFELHISANALTNIALHPSEPLIAVESLERINQVAISVYNTQSGNKLYEFIGEEGEIITHFSFSPQGRYLVLASNNRGLHRLQARSGIPVKAYKSIQAADYFLIGKSTKNILTYQDKTGMLAYYNFRTGAPIQSFQSQRGLTSIISPSTRYSVGLYRNTSLYLLDVSNGSSTELYRSADSIVAFTVDPITNTLYIIEEQFDEYLLISMALSNTKSTQYLRIPFRPATIQYAGERSIYISELSGKLYVFDPKQRQFSLVLDHYHAPIDRFSFSKRNEFQALCRSNLILAEFYSSDTHPILNKLRYTSVVADELFFSARKAYTLPENRYPGFAAIPVLPIAVSPQTAQQLEVYDDVFLYQTQSDRIVLQHSKQDTPIIDFFVPGVTDITYIPAQRLIIIAQPNVGMLNTSLLAIHSETQETIPIESKQFLSYDVYYNEEKNLLYSLGLERNTDGRVHTSVEVHDGNSLQFYWKSVEMPSEQLQASLSGIDDTTVLVGIGNTPIQWYDESVIAQELSLKLRYYTAAQLSPDSIAALRNDGSIVLMNKNHSSQKISIYCNSKSSRWELISQESELFYPFSE